MAESRSRKLCVIFAKTDTMSWQYTRQIICEKNHSPLALPTAPQAMCKNPLHLTQNKKKEPGGVSDNHCSCTRQAPYLQWADAMVDKQPLNNQAMSKLPISTLSATAYPTKTSKQTNEEKQAKKKEWCCGEASWSAAKREREGPGSCTSSNFQAQSTLFSILPTSALIFTTQTWGVTLLI